MADARLNIIIQATDRASRQIKGVTAAIQRNSAAFKKAGLVVSAFGAAGILAFTSFAKAALEQEKALKTLAATVEATGTPFDDVREKIEATTAALQRKTNFGDEEQIRALSQLLPIMGDVEMALAALPVLLDASSSSGKSLETVVSTMGRALSGATNTSIILGVTFDKTATFADRLAIAQQKVGGAAEANADPFTQLGNVIGDLKEVIGNQILPVLKPLLKGLGGFIDRLQNLDPRLLKTITLVALAAVAFATLAGPLLLLLGFLPAIIAGVTALGGAMAIAMGPIGLIALALVGLGAAGFLLIKNWDKVKVFFIAIWRLIWGGVSPVVNLLTKLFLKFTPFGLIIKHWRSLAGFFMALWDGIKGVFLSGVSAIIKLLDPFIKVVSLIGKGFGLMKDKVAKEMGDVRAEMERTATVIIDESGRMAREVTEAARGLDRALKAEEEAAEEAAEAAEKLAESIRDTVAGIIFMRTEAGQLSLTVKDVGLAFLDAGGSVEDLRKALETTADAALPINALLGELNLASLDVAIAIGKVESAASKAATVLKNEMAKAAEEAERALADAKREMESFNESIASMVEKARFATTEAGKLGISADDVRLAFLLAGGGTKKLSEILKDSAGRWNDVEFMMAKTGLTAKGITKLLGALREESDKLRKSLEETAKVSGLGGFARRQIAEFPTVGDPAVQRALVVTANLNLNADEFQRAIRFFRANPQALQLPTPFQEGGIVTRPTLALLGEKGPEAVVPLGRGRGMGVTINFNAPVYGMDDFKRRVAQSIRDTALEGGFHGITIGTPS